MSTVLRFVFACLLAAIVGCTYDVSCTPGTEAPSVQQPPTTPKPSVGHVGTTKAPEPMVYDLVFTPRVGGEVENATLRAALAWQRVTQNTVKFVTHKYEDHVKCVRSTVYVDEVSEPLGTGAEDVVAQQAFNSCFTVTVMNPWTNTESFRSMYDRLEVNPFVPTVAHELGHVLGLAHQASTQNSVMVPFITQSQVTGPTCQDVNALELLRETVIPCDESNH